jgi:hypothetical protein
MDTAMGQLAGEVEQLWAAVTELAVIVLDDQPEPGGLAAADVLGEQVSELQGEIAALREVLTTPRDDAMSALPVIGLHTQAFQARYWRQLRSHEAQVQLSRAIRRAGGHWPAWQRTVAATARRCEAPLELTTSALQLCGQEAVPLLDAARARIDQYQRPSIHLRRMS